MLYPALWAYRTVVKTATVFSPYQLVHGVESILPVECEIPSLKLVVELLPDTSPLEESLVHLEQIDEQHQDALVALEVNKRCVKAQYDKYVHPRVFSEGYLVLLWDQSKEPLEAGKFNPMWRGPYVVKRVLEKGSYELVDYEGIALAEPRNRLMIFIQGCLLYIIVQLCIVRSFYYRDRVCD